MNGGRQLYKLGPSSLLVVLKYQCSGKDMMAIHQLSVLTIAVLFLHVNGQGNQSYISHQN